MHERLWLHLSTLAELVEIQVKLQLVRSGRQRMEMEKLAHTTCIPGFRHSTS